MDWKLTWDKKKSKNHSCTDEGIMQTAYTLLQEQIHRKTYPY